MYGALRIPMSLEEYHLLPRKLGWTYDYEGGRAIVGPAEVLVDLARPVRMPVPAVPIDDFRCRTLEAEHVFALEKLYFDAFRPTPEATGLDDGDILAEASFSMILYASGALGAPLRCSRVVSDGNEPVAALLVAETSAGPRMQVVMVHPHFQRRGLATALLGDVCATLESYGAEEILSRCLLANEPARRWYRKMGFVERPDRKAVDHFRKFYHYERARLQDRSPSAELREVERELRRWERMARLISPTDTSL